MLNKNFLAANLFIILQTTFALAQTVAPAPGTPEAAATTAPAWMQFVPIAFIMVIFYFFLIRPQAKKQQEQKNFLSTLKTGDLVITQSGILGKISGLNEAIINLEVASGVQIKVLRTQVLALQNTLQNTAPTK